jgi:IS30 family transposase
LVIGANHKEAIATVVDRKSGYSWGAKVGSKNAEEVSKAICKGLKGENIHTITFDNGKEFAKHEKISEELGVKIYFAHPYSSYERGSNENFNGLLRQYFPKKTDFRKITKAEVDLAIKRLNDRPRKRLGFKTPAEVFHPM